MSVTADTQTANTLPGSEFPLGATVTDTGTNFAVASEVANGMMLCLFDQAGAAGAALTVPSPLALPPC